MNLNNGDNQQNNQIKLYQR